MKTIKESKFREVLEKQNLPEGFISQFINYMKKSKKERELAKLTNDPEYQSLLKKYNIKPVQWTGRELTDD